MAKNVKRQRAQQMEGFIVVIIITNYNDESGIVSYELFGAYFNVDRSAVRRWGSERNGREGGGVEAQFSNLL